MTPNSLLIAALWRWALAVAPLVAQDTRLTGTLVGTDGVAVSGAVVYVLDGSGVQIRAVLSDGQGRFRVSLPGTDTYSLRIERIGFETERVEDVAVTVGGHSQTITLRVRPLELDPLEVTAERVCRAEANSNQELVRLWTEVRKALTQTTLSSAAASNTFRVELIERTLTPDLKLLRSTADTVPLTGGHAFTFQPVEELGTMGWGHREDDAVTTIYGPSPDAFLSPRFGATHCLSLAKGPSPEGWVGIAFESIPDSLQVGLRGTFWVAPVSWRLQRIDFRYTGTADLTDAEHQGGRIILGVGAEGEWYAAAWSVVGPLLEPSGSRYSRVADNLIVRRQAYRVAGYIEHAGRVLAPVEVQASATSPWAAAEASEAAAGNPTARQAAAVGEAIRAACPGVEGATLPAVVAGTVTDSVSAVALVRARVQMTWSPDQASPRSVAEVRTDGVGYYQFCDAPSGQTVVLTATLGDATAERAVEVEPSTLHIEHVRLPLSDPDGSGLLVGRVVDAVTRTPIRSASVTLDELQGARALSNERGYFSLGRTPWGVYHLSVSALGYATRTSAMRMQGGMTQTVEVELTAEPIPIEGLDVVVRGRSTGNTMDDMVRRMRLGFGNFVTRDRIEGRPAARVAELLREAPGVQVFIPGPDNAYLEVRGRQCIPDVFVDGVPWLNAAETALTSLYGADVEAIEVYKGISETPAEFMGTGPPPCAVVVIWRR